MAWRVELRPWRHAPSHDVDPPLAQFHLLGRGTGLLSFRCGRMACSDALSAAIGRLLCKSRLRFLPLYTATVVRYVVTPADTVLRLFSRGRAATGEMGVLTSDAPWCVSAVALRMAEELVALTLQRAFGSYVRLHRHSQTAEFVE